MVRPTVPSTCSVGGCRAALASTTWRNTSLKPARARQDDRRRRHAPQGILLHGSRSHVRNDDRIGSSVHAARCVVGSEDTLHDDTKSGMFLGPFDFIEGDRLVEDASAPHGLEIPVGFSMDPFQRDASAGVDSQRSRRSWPRAPWRAGPHSCRDPWSGRAETSDGSRGQRPPPPPRSGLQNGKAPSASPPCLRPSPRQPRLRSARSWGARPALAGPGWKHLCPGRRCVDLPHRRRRGLWGQARRAAMPRGSCRTSRFRPLRVRWPD